MNFFNFLYEPIRCQFLHFCSKSTDWYLKSTTANYFSCICSKPIHSESDSNVTQKKSEKGLHMTYSN